MLCLRDKQTISVHGTFWTKGKVMGNEVRKAGRGQIMQSTVVSGVSFVIGGFTQ